MGRFVPGFRTYLPPLIQWQPTLTSHDPNPPIPIDEGGGGTTVVLATVAWKWVAGTLHVNQKQQVTLALRSWKWQGQALGVKYVQHFTLTLQTWLWRAFPVDAGGAQMAPLLMLLRVGH